MLRPILRATLLISPTSRGRIRHQKSLKLLIDLFSAEKARERKQSQVGPDTKRQIVVLQRHECNFSLASQTALADYLHIFCQVDDCRRKKFSVKHKTNAHKHG